MAYYFLFPEKDTTLYSHPDRKDMNTGADEILEILKERGTTNQYNYPSRVIMKFKDTEIQSTISLINKIDTTIPADNFNNGSAAVSLQLTSTDATKLVETNVLNVYAVSQSWNEGVGRYLNHPTSSTGATWSKRDNSVQSTSWSTSSWAPFTTGSLISASILTPGGGVWYTGSKFVATQQFLVGESLDTDVDVTEIVKKWSASMFAGDTYPEGILNNGVLFKVPDSVESNVEYSFGDLSYFSSDTHTIYPPKLTFKWDDSTNQSNDYDNDLIVKSGSINVDIYDNKKEYNVNEIAEIRWHIRDRYPIRTFSTSSNYLVNKRFKLGSGCLYSIRDAHSEQVIIPFDKKYTRLSNDKESSYFKLYMNGLQPERYYRILIKHESADGTEVYDNGYYFKVVR